MDNKIYKKLSDIQMALLGKQFNKSGVNKFGNFKYFELRDILPGIMEECYKRGIVLSFSFMGDYAVLKLHDTENDELIDSNRVAVPELKELNSKMNIVQSYGAYMTYLKRYLLLNTFLICEDSYIDSEAIIENPEKPHRQLKENYLHSTPEKQRVAPQTGEEEKDNNELKTPEDYLQFFEEELTRQGLHLNTITLYKMCTKYAKAHSNFKQKEVRELIQKKYGGK